MIDDDDYERVVSQGKWYALSSHPATGLFYACRSILPDDRRRIGARTAEQCAGCGAPITQLTVGQPRIYCGRACAQRQRKIVMMHNFISGYRSTDHRDRNGLNNQRANLRAATTAQNSRNTGLRANNSSGFKGVHATRGRWRAVLRVDGRRHHLGYFATAEAAGRAYDAAAVDLCGEFAWLNFPERQR